MTSLTDHYAPYDFSDIDGPGCGVEGHAADCLCDVDLSLLSPEQRATTPSLSFAETARTALYDRDVAPTAYNYFSELLGLYEAAQGAGARISLTADEVAELVTQFHIERGKSDRQGGGHHRGHGIVVQLVKAGLDLRVVARLLDVPEAELGRLFSKGEERAEAVVEAAVMLHRGARSFHQVEASTGLDSRIVKWLADTLGYASTAAASRRSGGGDVHGADVKEKVIRLHFDEGRSYTDIAEVTGVPRKTVATMCLRHRKSLQGQD